MFGKLLDDLKKAATDSAKELEGNVQSTIDRVKGKSPEKRYPLEFSEKVTNRPDYANGSWQKSMGYEFAVKEVYKATGVIAGNAKGWTPFKLQINPQELTQDEIFAIQVTPTFRGVLVEHQGVTIKDITISGTTGLSPLRREGGALDKSGAPLFQIGHSGFEEFHELRSYFRTYVEMKRQESNSGDTENRLVFTNYKDKEYLFVEPQKFAMKRNAAKSFLYDYTISMKAIGVATPEATKNETISSFNEAANTLALVSEYTDLATKTITQSFAVIARFQRDLTAAILSPLQNINSAVDAVRAGLATNFGEFGITRRSIQSLKDELGKIESNFNDIIGKKSNEFNKAIGRLSTLQAAIGRQPTYNEYQILNGIQAGKKACLILMSQLELFEPNMFETNAQVLALYPNAKIDVPNSVTTATISGGDNIQTIALRELGSVDKFKDIVILNNLKPPYISEAGGPGVLKPGQKILIPSQKAAGVSSVVKSQRYNITNKMQQAEIDLGVDIRLNEDADLVFTNTKDLDLVAGVENMVQAVAVKLLLDRGGLKRHPEVGTSLQIGSKAGAGSVAEIKNEILSSFMTDSRIESIPYIELRQDGGTIFVNMLVKIKEIEQPVPLPLTLNIG